MDALRTPDDCFADLPDWPFEPNYVEIDDRDGGALRVHFVEEGPDGAAPVLLLHGEPTWGYLYRKMIPLLVDAGHRVIVPDLVGFGRSDKPTERTDYTYSRHVDWVEQVLISLDLDQVTYFGQDWGSLIGLAVLGRHPDRFERIVLANGGLPDPRNINRIIDALATSPDPEAFSRWQHFASGLEELDVGDLMRNGLAGIGGTSVPISDAEAAAYDAPFPDASYQAGALVFPSLVSSQGPDDDVPGIWSATWEVLERWEKPLLCCYGKADPVLGYFDQVFIEAVPGAAGQPHQQFAHGGHFIQEHEPQALAEALIGLIASS